MHSTASEQAEPNVGIRRSSFTTAKDKILGLRRPSPTKQPRRSTRTTASPDPPPPVVSSSSRPAFSTNQQHFTPAKKLPHHRGRSPSPSKSTQAPTIRTFQTLKAQAHLLQLSLLSQQCDTTYAAWTASAHDKLHARFLTLQETYTSSLRTARATRQSRNLLALYEWSGGNDASLARKLSVLGTVLGELCDLTRGDAAWLGCDEARARGWSVDVEDTDPGALGEYTRCVRQFEGWVEWVESVWAARDKTRGIDDDGEASPPITPVARRQSNVQETAFLNDVQQHADTHLEGLGDSIKGSLRGMGTTLDRLSARLEELKDPEIPVPLAPESGVEGGDEAGVGVGPVPTPKILVEVAWKLVQGMREELQVMREIEFEVTVGEKTWMEQRVKAIGMDVVGGFGTPRVR